MQKSSLYFSFVSLLAPDGTLFSRFVCGHIGNDRRFDALDCRFRAAVLQASEEDICRNGLWKGISLSLLA
jgi:hypothetical protein